MEVGGRRAAREQPTFCDQLLSMFCCVAPPSADGRSAGTSRGENHHGRGGGGRHGLTHRVHGHNHSERSTFASTTALLSDRSTVTPSTSAERTFPRGYRAPPMPSPLSGYGGGGGGGGDDDGSSDGPDDGVSTKDSEPGESVPSALEHERLLKKKFKGEPVDSGDVRLTEASRRGGFAGVEGEQTYEGDHSLAGGSASNADTVRMQQRSFEGQPQKDGVGVPRGQGGHHHRTGSEPTWMGSYGRSSSAAVAGAGASAAGATGVGFASGDGGGGGGGVEGDSAAGCKSTSEFNQTMHRRGASCGAEGMWGGVGATGVALGLPAGARNNGNGGGDGAAAGGKGGKSIKGGASGPGGDGGKRKGGGSGGGKDKPAKAQLAKVAAFHALGRSASMVSMADDECCPTCFEEYTPDNPKMPLVCGHHFHLGCIYEWYERSEKCPVCEEKMEFEPSTGMCL